jgi:hypothetical protein
MQLTVIYSVGALISVVIGLRHRLKYSLQQS